MSRETAKRQGWRLWLKRRHLTEEHHYGPESMSASGIPGALPGDSLAREICRECRQRRPEHHNTNRRSTDHDQD